MSWHCPDCGHINDTEKRCAECYYRRPDPAAHMELPDPASVELLREARGSMQVAKIFARADALCGALLDVAMGDQVAWTRIEHEELVAQLEGSTDRLDDWLDIRT